MIKRISLIAVLAGSIILTSCGSDTSGGAGAAGTRQPTSVKAYQAVRQDLSRTLTYSGTVEPIGVASISPDMPGKIQSLMVDIGEPVLKGQQLAVMDNTTLTYQLDQARAALAVARANKADTEKNWQRNQNLYGEGAISEQQYEKARLGDQAAEAQLKQAEANLNLLDHQYSRTFLRSPFKGVVTQRGFEEGDLVNPAMGRPPIYTVMDITAVTVGLQVPHNEIDFIYKDQAATLEIATTSRRTYPGQVNIVNIAADAGSKTFYVETLFSNTDGSLRPGTFGDVHVEVERRESVLVVPRTALLDGNIVFIIQDGKAYRTRVELGLITPDWVEIITGLSEHDTVIIEGGYTLADSSDVQIQTGEF